LERIRARDTWAAQVSAAESAAAEAEVQRDRQAQKELLDAR
jgi:hypothetical protein